MYIGEDLKKQGHDFSRAPVFIDLPHCVLISVHLLYRS